MTTWTSIGENLVRHQGGTIYLCVKIDGKTLRRRLRIDDLRTAKRLRNLEMEKLQQQAALKSDDL